MKQLQQQAKAREAAQAAAKAAEAAAKEKDAQRKWILQYAEDESESEPDDDSNKVPWQHTFDTIYLQRQQLCYI